jgi:hypothetical protein
MTTNSVLKVENEPARRRLILALGRGFSGKSLWSRWLVETMRLKGVSPVVGDADYVTHNLSRHVDDAIVLGKGWDAHEAWWRPLTANGEELASRPVVVDFSPDKGLICRVDGETRDFAERHATLGFDVTKVFFLAPDVGDAVLFGNAGAEVTATATILVLNEGAPGSLKEDRFDGVLAHPAVRDAIGQGAHVVRMPELNVDRNKVSQIALRAPFDDDASAKADTRSFERHVIRTWLGRMDEAFAPFGRELALG